MTRYLFGLLFLTLVACKKKQEKTPPTNASESTVAVETVKPPKTMDDYFAAYRIVDEISLNDSVIIHEKTDNFIRFEHFPKEGEIIGTIYVSLLKLPTKSGAPKFVSFMHACVEGSCNLSLSNLKVWSADFKDITATSTDQVALQAYFEQTVKKLAKDKKKKQFDSFFALLLPDEMKFMVGVIDDDDRNMMEGKSTDTEFGAFDEWYWNQETEKFQKDYPNAG